MNGGLEVHIVVFTWIVVVLVTNSTVTNMETLKNIFSKIKPRTIIALDKTEYTKKQKKKTAEREFSCKTINLKRTNPEKSANIKSPINDVTITDVTQW